MPRLRARVDANQKEIVNELREKGYTVQHLHQVGKGCPDILVGYRGRNFLFEIKDPAKVPSQRKLTPDEEVWFSLWDGQVDIIHTADEAIDIIHK